MHQILLWTGKKSTNLHNATLVTSLQEQQSKNRCVQGAQCRFFCSFFFKNTKPPCSRKHLDLIFTDEAGRRDRGLLKLIVQSVSSRRPWWD